jgi:hypothetical protein
VKRIGSYPTVPMYTHGKDLDIVYKSNKDLFELVEGGEVKYETVLLRKGYTQYPDNKQSIARLKQDCLVDQKYVMEYGEWKPGDYDWSTLRPVSPKPPKPPGFFKRLFARLFTRNKLPKATLLK